MLSLIAIDRDGKTDGTLAAETDDVRAAMATFLSAYEAHGYELPWVGYILQDEGQVIGAGHFYGPPVQGKVRIAFSIFAGHENKGYGTKLARILTDIAYRMDPGLFVRAWTVPQEGAPTVVLEKAGFEYQGAVYNDEEGLVWEWHHVPL